MDNSKSKAEITNPKVILSIKQGFAQTTTQAKEATEPTEKNPLLPTRFPLLPLCVLGALCGQILRPPKRP